jgi:hypothetical protein
MISSEIETLWEKYLAAERVRIRQEMLKTLDDFIQAFVRIPTADWHPWALEIARRVVDEGEDIPVRWPLFRAVLFPALFAGLAASVPGSARWLAGFAQLLYQSPDCCEQLSEELHSDYGLLLRAVRDDPSDTVAKTRLLRLMRCRFDYVLHHLPAGVLYGCDGASIEECDELLNQLSAYERLAVELGLEEEERDLIAKARFYIPAYQRYLFSATASAAMRSFLLMKLLDRRDRANALSRNPQL